jgi:hypothetical protein
VPGVTGQGEGMKQITLPIVAIALVLLTAGFKMSGRGENRPTVQSTLSGDYYVRSVPSGDDGTEGTTKVFQVKRDGDELLDEYPVYMRGELYLGWSPIVGKWCLVHLEPERITSNNDFRKLGKVSRLAFYMGGKSIKAYTGPDLEKMGLKRKVATLVSREPGTFMVLGICQIPRTNSYVLKIEKISKEGGGTETILLDVTTGKCFAPDSEERAEQSPAGDDLKAAPEE